MTSVLPMTIPQPEPFDELLSLKGRCAIVTGGTRGIGEAIVIRLAQAGACVVVTDIREDALGGIQQKVSAFGGTAIGVHADCSSVADARRVVDTAKSRFGGVDILVNNAAIFQTLLTIEMTEEIWDQTVDTDMKGPFFLAKFAALSMIESGRRGKIINLLSTEIFRPTTILPAYGAAKAGLLAATQSMALEFAEHGILVNAVIPGSTLTPERIAATQSAVPLNEPPPGASATFARQRKMLERIGSAASRFPLGRTGFPDDLAKAVLFMASDMSNYVSGTSLTVDGAQHLF